MLKFYDLDLRSASAENNLKRKNDSRGPGR
jgi:hypothetical protein